MAPKRKVRLVRRSQRLPRPSPRDGNSNGDPFDDNMDEDEQMTRMSLADQYSTNTGPPPGQQQSNSGGGNGNQQDQPSPTTSEILREIVNSMPAGRPPDQNAYNDHAYGLPAQQLDPNQFQHDMFPQPQSATTSNLGPAFGAPLNQALPRSITNLGSLPSMTAGAIFPNTMHQQGNFGSGYILPTPPGYVPGLLGPVLGGGPFGTGYGPPYQQNPSQFAGYGTANPSQYNPYTDPNRTQYPPPAGFPDQRQCAPLQLIGFPTHRYQPIPGSSSGALDPNVYGNFPAPTKHETLNFQDPNEGLRQLLYYVDDGPQRAGESWEDYRERRNRCAQNMFTVYRPPRLALSGTRQERMRQLARYNFDEAEHRDRLDRNRPDTYDRTYEQGWRAWQAKRRAYNARRRTQHRERLRREYENHGFPNFPDPPDYENSGDELWTHDGLGPLPPTSNGASQDRGNSRGRRPRQQGRNNAQSGQNSRQSTQGSNRPLNEGGLSGQAQGPPLISRDRCKTCARAKVKCTIQATGKPCDRCHDRDIPCEDHIMGRRGVKSGDKRGQYNKNKDKTTTKQPKKKQKSKKAVDTEEEEEEEDLESTDDDEEPELNDDEEDEEEPESDADEDEGMEERPETPPTPPPRNEKKRGRDPPDDEAQDEWEPKRRTTRRMAARNTLDPSPTPRKKSHNQNPTRRRNGMPASSFRPCANCRANGRHCDNERPCTQCLNHGERDCGGEVFNQPYRPEIPHMTTPTRAYRPGTSTYPTPNSGSYTGRPAQGFEFPRPVTGYFQPRGMIDETIRPLGSLISLQRQNVPNATAWGVLQENSRTWRGGRDPATAEAARNYRERDFGDQILDPTSADNLINPALRTAENPYLPSSADLRVTRAPQAAQQTHNPNNRAQTQPVVNHFIGIARIPSANNFNDLLPCQEPKIEQPQPICGDIPTKPCNDIRHVFNVCKPCETIGRAGEFGLDEEAYSLSMTQQPMCRYCADNTKTQFNQNPNSGIQGNDCLCMGQLRMAWLCGLHRGEAHKRVNARAQSYEEWRIRNDANGNCPVCSSRKGDDSTRVWICGSCGEKVVAP
jgi:hypothetical protein